MKMRITILVLLLLWVSVFTVAQEKDEWRRVYTMEDAVIDMNTSKVTFGDKRIGRVRFRWVLKKPEALKEMPGVSYKSRLETIEFKCYEERYRLDETTLLDAKGKVIRSDEQDPLAEWKAVKPGGMMERLFRPACALIESKRRKP
jgi:hypothetical protein